VSGGPDDGKDANQLIARVDQLIKRQQEDSLRAVEEVPLLTEIVEQDAAAAAAGATRDEALATDIERVLVVRLIPELNKQIAGLRSELEKQLRRSVREAVEHALAARKANPKH
jgi:adenosylcobinamide amidohydrolase